MKNISLPKGSILPTPKIVPNISAEQIKRITEQTQNNISYISESIDEMNKIKEKRYQDGVIRENRIIELLESIDKNTSVLSDIVSLLKENTENRNEILEIINEFNSLATIEDESKVQSTYRKIMNKLNTMVNDINTINALMSYGIFIINVLQNIGKI